MFEARHDLELLPLLVRLLEGLGLHAHVAHLSRGGTLELNPGLLVCEANGLYPLSYTPSRSWTLRALETFGL